MKRTFSITGMTCAACAAHVEKAVKALDLNSVEVNLLMNRMTVEGEAGDGDIIAAVESAGYGASRYGGDDKNATKAQKPVDYSRTLLARFIASMVFLLPLMWFSMGHMWGFPLGAFDPHRDPASFALIQLILTTPVLVINGRFFIGGAKSVLHRAPNMDTLVSLGSGASYIYGVVVLFLINGKAAAGDISGAAELAMNLFFESAAMILALVTLGKFLESKSKGKTRAEVDKLLRLRPQTANVIRDGKQINIPVDEIAVGDTVVVLPGEYVPCDGVVVSGGTTLDKSAVTGESIPEEATEGSAVTSATLNLTGRIELRAEKVGADTTLSKIIELIENAGGSKAPIQKIADKVSAVFVPVVCAVALVTLVVWLFVGTVGQALTMAISVLVISCPCALGLATPVAVMAGTGRAAAYGVLVKNAEVLQGLQSVEIFALDKTATITEGKPKVTGIVPRGDMKESEILAVAAALEATSTHPLAKAIAEAGGDVKPAESSEYRIGYGVIGKVDGTEYALGGERLCAEFGLKVPPTDAQTVYLCRRGNLLGEITVDDGVKPTSRDAVKRLTDMGGRVVMITGDNARQAKRIADSVGITEIYSDVLPEDKLDIVNSLKAQGITAMVGDGINDAPALKAADIGIAIGSGTDVAIEAADVVLVKSDLADVPRAVAVSRMSLKNIKENLFWAFIYNTLGIPLAAGVFYALGVTLNPMIAAGAMAFSSLFVVCNALRLTVMRFDDKHLGGKLKRGVRHSKRRTAGTDDAKSCGCDGGTCCINDDKTSGEAIPQQGDNSMKVTFSVKGMMCMNCVGHVKKALSAVDGVTAVEVSLENGEAVVEGEFDTAAAIAAVGEEGYECAVKR
ncbi:MAG: heavy metal translocating P-type ATPase [Clostridia bacterium]|nr:heavy metal translocating P-type ATPase [Clostridia bacterium]